MAFVAPAICEQGCPPGEMWGELPAMKLVIEVEDVEVTHMPPTVFYKLGLRVLSYGAVQHRHHVMKRFFDLQDFHHALARELSFIDHLPSPPQPVSLDDLVQYDFLAYLNMYFEELVKSPLIVETFSFRNFFQFSAEYQGCHVPVQASKHMRPAAEVLSTHLEQRSTTSSADGSPAVLDCGGSWHSGPRAEKGPGLRASPVHVPVDVDSGLLLHKASDKIIDTSDCTVEECVKIRRHSEGHYTLSAPKLEENLDRRRHTIGHARGMPLPSTEPWPPKDSETGALPLIRGSVPAAAPWAASVEPDDPISGQGQCVVCMAAPQEQAIDPCGHLSMCHACAATVGSCPVCRGPIKKLLRVYVA